MLSSSGGVVSSLAGRRSHTDELLGLGLAVVVGIDSFNRLGEVSELCLVGSVGSARSFIFGDIRKGDVFGAGYSSELLLAQGTFEKHRRLTRAFFLSPLRYPKKNAL